jgi:hypothetical protein
MDGSVAALSRAAVGDAAPINAVRRRTAPGNFCDTRRECLDFRFRRMSSRLAHLAGRDEFDPKQTSGRSLAFATGRVSHRMG